MRKSAKRGEATAFFEMTLCTFTDDCILWPFSITKKGYAKLAVKRVTRDANRVACERAHGEPPTPKHEAAHSCGNRLCINWQHQRWDTRSGNHADKLRHGTHHRGERCPTHKLTVNDVREIRAARSTSGLACRFGVSRAQIIRVRERKQWAWL